MGATPPLRIIIAGGGTGGHLFPAIAVANEFVAQNPKNRICFVSTGNTFEKAALGRAGFRLKAIAAEGIKGRGLWRQLRAVVKIPMGVFQSIRIINRFRPDLVVGMGSYAAGPVVIGAWLSAIPVVLHEQNVLPGLTNRVLSRFADRVYVSFQSTCNLLASQHVSVTGNPVRKEILAAGKNGNGAMERPFTVLVLGGSQGAHSINLAMADAVDRLQGKSDYFFIHQTGTRDAAFVTEAYQKAGCGALVKPFFENMADQYQKADLVICRAGATTVAEVTALGKGAVLIPYPYAADNHQTLNARSLSEAGAAQMILEQDLSGRGLSRVIENYTLHPGVLAQMGNRAKDFGNPDAAVNIVKDCYGLLEKSRAS